MARDKTVMVLDVVQPTDPEIIAKARERLPQLAPDDHEYLAMVLGI